MSDHQLPEHLERLLGNSGDWICVKCGPTDATFHENCTHCGTPLATEQEVTKLRTILAAACAVDLADNNQDAMIAPLKLVQALDKLKEALAD